jgi:hypothetical protein
MACGQALREPASKPERELGHEDQLPHPVRQVHDLALVPEMRFDGERMEAPTSSTTARATAGEGYRKQTSAIPAPP